MNEAQKIAQLWSELGNQRPLYSSLSWIFTDQLFGIGDGEIASSLESKAMDSESYWARSANFMLFLLLGLGEEL